MHLVPVSQRYDERRGAVKANPEANAHAKATVVAAVKAAFKENADDSFEKTVMAAVEAASDQMYGFENENAAHKLRLIFYIEWIRNSYY